MDISLQSTEPFSVELLRAIFELAPNEHTQLVLRESNQIEFKRTFHFEAFDTHARTFAAFANCDGGYLLFGVDDKTREVVGLNNDKFDRLDPRAPTEFLNSIFAPEIRWASNVYEVQGKKIGLIYVWPATQKPVMATRNGRNVRDGEIFYRYNGLTETIKYAELRNILDEQRRREQELWLKHLKRLATIGLDNAGILNLMDGSVTGRSGTFVIDASLLPKLQFIREGDFQEKDGAPTIRIIGDAEILAAGELAPVKTKLTFIRSPEIIRAFLWQELALEPLEYIRAVCFEQSSYLPIYYFAYLAEISLQQLNTDIGASDAAGKHALLRRLSEDIIHKRYYCLPKTHEAAQKRLTLIDSMVRQELDLTKIENPYHVIESLQLLTTEQAASDFVIHLLRDLYERYWNHGGNTASLLRKAICHIDYVLYRNKIENH
jgi:hypothetical protein